MKKTLICFLFILMIVTFISCHSLTTNETTTQTESSSTSQTSLTNSIPSSQSTVTDHLIEGLSQAEVDLIKDETVTLNLSFYLGSNQTDDLIEMAADFEERYPNVTINLDRKQSDDSVVSEFKTNAFLSSKSDLILADQDYLALATPLFSPIEAYSLSHAEIDGHIIGIDETVIEEDYFSIYDLEDEKVTFPFTRKSQLIFANRDMMSQYATQLQTLDINVTNDGYLMSGFKLGFDDLQNIKTIYSSNPVLTLEDSYRTLSSWLYEINGSLLNGSSYVINTQESRDFMSQLRTLSQTRVIDLASTYSSEAFNQEQTLLAVSDVESLRYMVTNSEFEVDIYPMIKLNDASEFFYGSDFAINDYSSDAEKLYSWLFIRYATDLSEHYLHFCINNGYSPIQKLTVLLEYNDYQNLLALFQDFYSSSGSPSWLGDDFDWTTLHYATIQRMYQYMRTSIRPFMGFIDVNTNNITTKRNAWQDAMESILYDNELNSSFESISVTLESILND